MRLARTGSGESATADAVSFANYLFASTPGVAVDSAALSGFADNETVIVECDAGATPLSSAAAVVVSQRLRRQTRHWPPGLGDRLIGTIATDVPARRSRALRATSRTRACGRLPSSPRDRMLAAPSVGEIRDILKAQVLYDGENELEVVEDVLLSPVYADPARPHFRRFASKAVLSPLQQDRFPPCRNRHAGCLPRPHRRRRPQPYVVDRAQGEATTVLLAPHETPETLTEMSEVWLRSRFRGERKAEAIHALLERRLDIPGLLRKL